MKPTLQNLDQRLSALESHRKGSQEEPLVIRAIEVDPDGNEVTTAWDTTYGTTPQGRPFIVHYPAAPKPRS